MQATATSNSITPKSLQLLVRQPPNSAIIFLRWCISQALSAELTGREGDALMFLTLNLPSGGEERRVAKLSSVQELIEFSRPGAHTIEATIVYGGATDLPKAAVAFLKRSGRTTYAHTQERAIGKECESLGTARNQVSVPAGFFAPPLHPLERWWLELVLDSMWDECAQRKRRIFAYSLQPILVLVWGTIVSLVRLEIALFLSVLCVRRGVDWAPVAEPFSGDIKDIWVSAKSFGSGFTEDENRKERRFADFLGLLVPIAHIGIGAVAMVLGAISMLFGLPFWIATGTSYATIFILLIAECILGQTAIPGYIASSRRSRKDRKAERVAENAASLRRERYQSLVCDVTNGESVRQHSLGEKFVLLVHDFKAKVCRPVARG